MKFIYATDLHGDTVKYEKLIDLCKEYNINLIVNGGDISPKRGDVISEQLKFINEFLPEYYKKLEENKIYYISMLGNDDLEIMQEPFDRINEKFPMVFDVGNKKIKFDGYEFIGMNSILDTPHHRKDHIITEEGFIPEAQSEDYYKSSRDGYTSYTGWSKKRETLPLMKDVLKELPLPEKIEKTIYIFHMPPKELHFGHIANLTRNVGSHDIYKFIVEKQPLLTLHGHLHENLEEGGRWIALTGKTISVQPGQTEKDEDSMIIAIVDIENERINREIIKL